MTDALENGPETPPVPPPQRTGRKFFLGVFLMCIIAALALLLWWLFGQRMFGTATVRKPDSETVAEKPIGRREYSGKFITFTYPDTYHEKSDAEPVNFPIVERFFLTQGGAAGKKIALLVQENTGYAFEEYSSYRIREQDPTTYRREKTNIHGLEVTIFTKEEGVFETVAFLESGTRVASLAITSPISMEGLREELDAVLETVVWKKAI
jgi:hypothetical protein